MFDPCVRGLAVARGTTRHHCPAVHEFSQHRSQQFQDVLGVVFINFKLFNVIFF